MSQVAIIMRSMNEMPYTKQVFAALKEQTFQDFVLYNVDSGSTDGTLEFVKAHNPDPSKVFEILPSDYVPGKVLNDMLARTKEPIVVLLNADAIPMDAHWLKELIDPIINDQADSTISRQIARPDAYWVVKQDYERAYDPRRFKDGYLNDFYSAVSCAFKRDLWEETQFYTGGYAEDLAWSRACKAKGARFKIAPESVAEHSHNYSIKGLYRKRYRQGVAFGYIYSHAPSGLVRAFSCIKEIARDLWIAVTHGRFLTIPYNLLYRLVIYLGYYRGNCEGVKKYSANTDASTGL